MPFRPSHAQFLRDFSNQADFAEDRGMLAEIAAAIESLLNPAAAQARSEIESAAPDELGIASAVVPLDVAETTAPAEPAAS